MATHNLAKPLHVLDLPQLYQKPSYDALLDALTTLSVQPQGFGREILPEDDDDSAGPMLSGGSTRYLTGIIASPLLWIENEDERENLWSLASRCLSNRSGRTAMGSMTRAFNITSTEGEEIKIHLSEPALTEDNLGLKTWASSLFLASHLRRWSELVPSNASILELGSGTGLLGLAASVVWHRHVILTDLPEIVPNLTNNIELNHSLLTEHKGQATGAVLDWRQPKCLEFQQPSVSNVPKFDIILAADPFYDPEHPQLLVQTIKTWLSSNTSARVFVSYPIRGGYSEEIALFHSRMADIGLTMLERHEEIVRDDWDDELLCRGTVWQWQSSVTER